MYPETNSWYCFGCGVGGDVIAFTMRAEGLTFREALQKLANEAGLPVNSKAAGVAPQWCPAPAEEAAYAEWKQQKKERARRELEELRGAEQIGWTYLGCLLQLSMDALPQPEHLTPEERGKDAAARKVLREISDADEGPGIAHEIITNTMASQAVIEDQLFEWETPTGDLKLREQFLRWWYGRSKKKLS